MFSLVNISIGFHYQLNISSAVCYDPPNEDRIQRHVIIFLQNINCPRSNDPKD